MIFDVPPALPVRCCMPVSYTHLDVYKRQVLTAARQNAQALCYVPVEMLNEKLLFSVLKRQMKKGIHYVPTELLTETLLEKLVAYEGKNLKYVPYHLRTAKLAKMAVCEDGNALAYVPQHLITCLLYTSRCV